MAVTADSVSPGRGDCSNGPFEVALGVPIVRLQSVIDGMSQTAAIAEFLGGEYLSRFPKRAVFDVPGKQTGDNIFAQFLNACESVDRNTAKTGDSKGREWIARELGQTLYNHAMRPNGNSCTNDYGTRSGLDCWQPAWGRGERLVLRRACLDGAGDDFAPGLACNGNDESTGSHQRTLTLNCAMSCRVSLQVPRHQS